MFGISTIEWNRFQWMRTTSLHDRADKLSKAKAYVFSDPVLCLGNSMNFLSRCSTGEENEWFMESPE